jgi:preprotein translocase subunit SecF
VELFRTPNFEFLAKKRYFLSFSGVALVASMFSILFWHGIPLSVDFKGGTLVYLKFADRPDEERVRQTMRAAGLADARVQRYGDSGSNELLIALDQSSTNEATLDAGKQAILIALHGNATAVSHDLNNASTANIREVLIRGDPLGAGASAEDTYATVARRVTEFRDNERGGVLRSYDDLRGTVAKRVLSVLRDHFFLSNFTVRNVEMVGPQVGEQLRRQAMWATALACGGMLIYLWFRFELICGVAAVVSVIHDVALTIGALSIMNYELSLTVIAAILTLIGYSVNDTIVIFDRIRENLRRAARDEPFAIVVNRSINQTLSRTVITQGLTVITVLALYVFGGEVLRGFGFTLLIGILIGGYSSFAVAAPLVVAYDARRRRRTAPTDGAMSTPKVAI